MGEIFKGFLRPCCFCMVWWGLKNKGVFREKIKKLMKFFGGENLMLYLFLGNDECEFWVWNYCVFFTKKLV